MNPARHPTLSLALSGDMEKALMLAMAGEDRPRTTAILHLCMTTKDLDALAILARHPLIDIQTDQWGIVRDAIHGHHTGALALLLPLVKNKEALVRLLLDQWQALPWRPLIVHDGLDAFGMTLEGGLLDEWHTTFGPACPGTEARWMDQHLDPAGPVVTRVRRL